MTEKKHIALEQGELWLLENFLTKEEAKQALIALTADTLWREDEISMFGRKVKIPRLQAFVGDPGITYRYSGLPLKTTNWPDSLAEIREKLEQETGLYFNAALLNLYRDGQDSMGWHSDNEKELGDTPTIASISLGASRRFLLRNKISKEKHEIVLNSGSLLWMAGEIQQHWQHSIPKTQRTIGPRINLTFRQFEQS